MGEHGRKVGERWEKCWGNEGLYRKKMGEKVGEKVGEMSWAAASPSSLHSPRGCLSIIHYPFGKWIMDNG
jgi:hypothetical protein